jgi:predicted XRE-type DNA-binding protein
METTGETTHEASSGDVFADLSFPNSEQELVKTKLTVQIYQILKERKVAQIEAARLLGTTQAQMSALMRCHPTSVSVGKLAAYYARQKSLAVVYVPIPTK